ncbi:hypothetical protein D3C81_2132420 [compost metagenome]
MQHAFLQLGIILGERSFSYDEHHIKPPGNFRFMMPDDLFYQPSHPVADNRISDLLADRHPQPEPLHLFSVEPVHYKLMIGK